MEGHPRGRPVTRCGRPSPGASVVVTVRTTSGRPACVARHGHRTPPAAQRPAPGLQRRPGHCRTGARIAKPAQTRGRRRHSTGAGPPGAAAAATVLWAAGPVLCAVAVAAQWRRLVRRAPAAAARLRRVSIPLRGAGEVRGGRCSRRPHDEEQRHRHSQRDTVFSAGLTRSRDSGRGIQVEARRDFRRSSPNSAGCVVRPVCPPGKCWSSVPRRSARKAAAR